MYISYNAELGGNTPVFLIPREFLIKLTHCLRFGLWKILVRFFWFFFFGCCFACSSFLVFITYSLNARAAIETNDLYGKCLSYMLGGIKNMYFYKLLVFLHIFIFAFIFLVLFLFSIICSTLRNYKHALFFASFGLLWFFVCTTPPSNNSPALFPIYCCSPSPPSMLLLQLLLLLRFSGVLLLFQTERCLRRQSVGGHVRNYTEKCGNASKFHL